jgi:hypothetical protein
MLFRLQYTQLLHIVVVSSTSISIVYVVCGLCVVSLLCGCIILCLYIYINC